MSAAERHYALLIHGTWSAPTSDGTAWYLKGEAFADALAHRLEGTPLAGAVWRSRDSKPTDFYWSGDNTHDARLKAAKALCDKVLAIRAVVRTRVSI